MIAGLFSKVILGAGDNLSIRELQRMSERQPFSGFLNYLAYDPKTKIYLNQDNSIGILWECSPLIYAGPKTITALEGLFRAGLPKGSILQFILHADSHIEPILTEYRKERMRDNPLVQTNTEMVIEYLQQGKTGISACANIPVRRFRLFIAVKMPDSPQIPKIEELCDETKIAPLLDIRRQLHETLNAAMLHPRHLAPDELLEWCRRLFNRYPDSYPQQNIRSYDATVPLRKQIINSETSIHEHRDHLQIGDNSFCCTTPKTMPKEVDPLQTNKLFGGIWGVVSDADQIKTDFLFSLNIVFESLETKLHAKCNLILNQQAVGSLSPSLQRKQEEYLTATDALERGIPFVKIMPVFWVWDRDLEKARDSCARVRRIWENQGYIMQQETLLLKVLFLSSLPMGLYTSSRNLETLERDFIAPISSVSPVLPVQGDFSGAGRPRLLFLGRKGQLASLDFFHRGAVNHNIFCCASSGTGKSFQVNFIAFNYYSCGALVRIIDIGGSYKKIANMLGARYLDFEPETGICLNPFTHIKEPQEELKSVAAVFAQMAYSNSPACNVDDTEMNLIRNAVRWAWQQYGQEADADTVYDFLMRFPEVEDSDMMELADNPKLIETARKLAFNIREFTSHGFHGRFFTGRSTFDIRSDEFVVLELENLKVQPDLYRVVTLLVINAVTQDLYLSDRSRPRLVIFDEAWQFLDRTAMLSPVINEGYRRARKYNGSFMVITQSIIDLENFGDVGNVINSNSAFRIFLESPDFDLASKKGFIDYDEFTMSLLKSIKSNPPKYSEFFFDTPFGIGVARLAVNDYAYFIYTSKADEISQIEEMVHNGMSYDEAIWEMVRRRQESDL